MTKILYITYNGLLDHIGVAQVLPYLLPMAKAGHDITVVSFEKDSKFVARGGLASELQSVGINWHPLRFNAGFSPWAKFRDLLSLRQETDRLCKEQAFDLIHCRSYIPASAGLRLKQKFGLPLLFDMRGLWVDQRRDGGRWKKSNPFYRLLYRYWKRKEAKIIRAADEIVTLTEACRIEVRRWQAYQGVRITVCPCCVDTAEFQPRLGAGRAAIREQLGLHNGAPLVVYLGSVGSVYYLQESLQFFERIYAANSAARFLFLGFHNRDMLEEISKSAHLKLPAEAFIARTLPRSEVPGFLGAADVGLCFIMPCYSSIGVSPTKLGEFLACGLPVFCNRGIGDVEELANRLEGVHVLKDFAASTLERMAAGLAMASEEKRQAIAHSAAPLLGLEVAAENYARIYRDYSKGRHHG